MTEREHQDWDALQNTLREAEQAVQAFWETMPNGPFSAARNRVEMAWRNIEVAQDNLSAARDRYTDAQTSHTETK